MEKKFYNTKEFKNLSKKWEQRLEQEGLKDIERTIGNRRELKQNSSNVYRQMDRIRIEAKEKYYQSLAQCFESSEFDSDVDKIVMEKKSQGATIKEICDELRAVGQSRCRGMVRFIVRKYEHRWKIKNWQPHQLNYQWRKNRATR